MAIKREIAGNIEWGDSSYVNDWQADPKPTSPEPIGMSSKIQKSPINLTEATVAEVRAIRYCEETTTVYYDRENGWTVELQRVPSVDETPWDGMILAAITHTTAKTVKQFDDPRYRPPITWDQMQQIKDMLWPSRVAIEVFPPQKEIVNVRPMRWMWVLPEGAGLPFSINRRYPNLGDSSNET